MIDSSQPHPDDNPKTAMGAKKLPLWVVPFSAMCALAEALADGARKYGPYNWRKQRITASTYLSAIKRHIGAWEDGEDYARDSGVHHLKHAMACLALMLDAMSIEMLNDDRPPKGAGPRLLEEWEALNRLREAKEGQE